MSEKFEQIASLEADNEVLINLDDAERFRSIGQNVILSSQSATHVQESVISSVLVASYQFKIPSLPDYNSNSLYGFVEDETYPDGGWRTRMKYHSYGTRDGGLLGFESNYEIGVGREEVLLARRAIYRLRDLKNVSVSASEINVELIKRRTMADVTLEAKHIDRLAERMKRLVYRAESLS